MSRMTFDIEWEAPEGAQGEELRATWAHLKILVGDTVVTRIDSLASGSVRSGIYLPLYPIAEWISSNWWSLLHEVPSQRSAEGNTYRRRHNLRSAAEGFAFPDLSIQPEGKRILLEWRPASMPQCRVAFLEGGSAVLDRDSVESALRKFVQAVIERLEDHGVQDTFLAQEWKAITEAGSEELEFCRAVGCLGGDPYSPETDEYADALIEFASAIPSSAAEEFLLVAEFQKLAEQGRVLRQFIDHASSTDLELARLRQLRDDLAAARDSWAVSCGTAIAPWDQGYAFARELRSRLGLSPVRATHSPESLGEVLGLDSDDWMRAISFEIPGLDFVNGAMAPARDGAPLFAIRANFDSGKVFALCRGLYEYLGTSGKDAALMTEAKSERQKRNRAFAAEFVVPAAGIKELLGGCVRVAGEQIASVADHFGVWDSVVRMQIQNQRIATIVDGAEF